MKFLGGVKMRVSIIIFLILWLSYLLFCVDQVNEENRALRAGCDILSRGMVYR